MNTKLVTACLNIRWWQWRGHGLCQSWRDDGHSSDSRPGRGHTVSGWPKCTINMSTQTDLFVYFFFLLKPTKDVVFAASVATATGKWNDLNSRNRQKGEGRALRGHSLRSSLCVRHRPQCKPTDTMMTETQPSISVCTGHSGAQIMGG